MEPTPEKQNILRLELDFVPQLDHLNEPLWSWLHKHANLSLATKPEELETILADVQKAPRIILVPDAALTVSDYESSLHKTLEYARNGGTVICMGTFSGDGRTENLRRFFERAGLPWKTDSYYRSETAISTTAVPDDLICSLPSKYSQKASYLSGTTKEEAWYTMGDTNEHLAAVAVGKVGQGRLAYFGDVNGEFDTQEVILRMCGLNPNEIQSPYVGTHKLCDDHGVFSCRRCNRVPGATPLPQATTSSTSSPMISFPDFDGSVATPLWMILGLPPPGQ